MVERRSQAERRAESRARLVEAAIELLATNGYARTSLVEIGKAAGTSRGLVIHHFGSKEACMQAVVCHIREAVAEEIRVPDASGADGLNRAIDVFFDLLRKGHTESRAMYVILIEGLTSTPGLRPSVAETNAFVRQTLVDILLRDEPDATAGKRKAAETLAVIVEGLLRGVALQWMADPDGVDLDAAVSLIKAIIVRETEIHELVS